MVALSKVSESDQSAPGIRVAATSDTSITSPFDPDYSDIGVTGDHPSVATFRPWASFEPFATTMISQHARGCYRQDE
jgi:hypothetical protein